MTPTMANCNYLDSDLSPEPFARSREISNIGKFPKRLPNHCALAAMLSNPETNQENLARGIALWESLSSPYQAVFNAALSSPAILEGYCKAPASLNHHHAFPGGTLQHSVEVAEIADGLVEHFPRIHRDVVLLAALLHDAGKAMEYECTPDGRHTRLTDRGQLVGHKITTVQLLTIAFYETQVLPEPERLAIVHAITACHAPDFAGLRTPRSAEVMLLSSADGISSQANFLGGLASPNNGWGKRHRALRGQVFTLPGNNA
jgi:3'-5' exoribonuclease